jgi:hypothetical protein
MLREADDPLAYNGIDRIPGADPVAWESADAHVEGLEICQALYFGDVCVTIWMEDDHWGRGNGSPVEV